MMDDEEVFGDSRTDDYSQRVTMYNNREFNQQVMIEGASYIRLLRDDSSTKMSSSDSDYAREKYLLGG